MIAELQEQLDGLEKALLSGDATAVETASAQVQAAMKARPGPAEIKNWGPPCRPTWTWPPFA
ncbi:MAG: hypothetical protein R3E42_19795 [Burkholderiaceae bacterium]